MFTVEAEGVLKMAREYDRAERKIQDKVNRMMRYLQSATESEFDRAVPRDTGQLAKGLRASISFRGGIVRITMRSTGADREGYNYLDVTRFGHRRVIIHPRRAKFLKFVPGPRSTAGARQARDVPFKGRLIHVQGRAGRSPIYRRWVYGVVRPRDWVETANEKMETRVRVVSNVLARDIARTVVID